MTDYHSCGESICFQMQEERRRCDATEYQEGIKHGIQIFQRVYQHLALSEKEVHDALMAMLLDSTYPSLWNAGYVIGWTKAYHERRDVKERPVPPHLYAEHSRQQYIADLLKYVKEGEMTLQEAADDVERVAQPRRSNMYQLV